MTAHTAITPAIAALRIDPAHRLVKAPVTDNYSEPHDVKDAWVEACGDEEQTAVVHFDHNWDGEQYNPTLACLEVHDRDEVTFYTPEGAIALMGADVVSAIEGQYGDMLMDNLIFHGEYAA